MCMMEQKKKRRLVKLDTPEKLAEYYRKQTGSPDFRSSSDAQTTDSEVTTKPAAKRRKLHPQQL